MQPLPPDNTRVHLSPPAMVGSAENPGSPGNKVLVEGSESEVVTCIEGRRGYSHRMLSRAIRPGITVLRSFLSARCSTTSHHVSRRVDEISSSRYRINP